MSRGVFRSTGAAPVVGVLAAVVAVVVGAWLYTAAARPARTAEPGQTAEPAQSGVAAPNSDYDTARRLLVTLPVSGWDREQDFSRHRFGERWSDDVDVEFGHNGCNTRDDILRRDLTDVELRRGSCLVARGVLHDPYTGRIVVFVRGPKTSEAVQIDHVVSLADAWYKGARAWDDRRRRDFANDPRNLLAVSAQANFDKAFRDAGGWLPPDTGFHCDFVARQIEVKTHYRLWVSANEKAAMRDVLADC